MVDWRDLYLKVRGSPALSAWLIVVVLTFCYGVGPASIWYTNDDVALSLLFSGKVIASSPDAHVVIVNYVLASLFVLLYKLWPSLPWYGVFHVGAILFSTFFFNYCFALTRAGDKFVLRLLLSVLSALQFLFLLQFTQTAMVLGVTGYLVLYLLKDAPPLTQWRIVLLHGGAVTCLILSFLLRRESFALASILCLALLVHALRLRCKPLLVSLVCSAVLMGICFGVDRNSYGEEWKNNLLLSSLMGKMTHSAYQYGYEENKKVFDAAGWSLNDYWFFWHWGYIDERVYSPESVRHILNNAAGAWINGFKERTLSAFDKAANVEAVNYLQMMALLALLVLVSYRREPLSCCLLLGSFLACAVYLCWTGRFPARVSMAIVYALPWALLVQSGATRRRVSVVVAAVALLGLTAVSAHAQYKYFTAKSKIRQERNLELHRFSQSLKESPTLFVTIGREFPFEGFLPFESVDYLDRAKIVWLAGLNQSPIQKRLLADFNITDIFSALLARDDCQLLTLLRSDKPVLQKYFLEHYGKAIWFEGKFFGDQYVACRVVYR